VTDGAEGRATPRGRFGLPLFLRRRPRRSGGSPIALHLLMLGAAVSLPAILFAGYLVLRFDNTQRQSTEAIAQASAASISGSVDRAIDGMMITLRVLASAKSMQDEDMETLHARTHASLRGSGTYFVLLDENYMQRLNTRVPFGTGLPLSSNPEAAAEALRTGGMLVSDLFFDQVSETFQFNVLAPLETAQGGRFVLALSRNAGDLQAVIDEQRLAEGWSIGLTDRSGRLIAGRGQQTIREIERFTQSLADLEAGGGAVHVERDGKRYLVAVEHVPLSRWRVTVWAPEEVIEQPLRETLQILVLAGLILLCATFGLALGFGRRIALPIRKLARNARSLGHGGPVRRFESPVAEVNEVSEALAVASDQRGAAEERVRLLMQEMSHRAKNQLAVVVAMARQTVASSETLEDFGPAFTERVQALSRSTSLLASQNWRAAGLRPLMQTQLEPFDGQDLPRVVLDGPDVELSADAAQNLGLALHEMATNASKYGALSVPEGKVAISWRIHGGEERRLSLVWEESGGPPVNPPARTGFGSVVIQRLVAQSLKAEVEGDYAPTGLIWRLDMPVDLLQPAHGLFG